MVIVLSNKKQIKNYSKLKNSKFQHFLWSFFVVHTVGMPLNKNASLCVCCDNTTQGNKIIRFPRRWPTSSWVCVCRIYQLTNRDAVKTHTPSYLVTHTHTIARARARHNNIFILTLVRIAVHSQAFIFISTDLLLLITREHNILVNIYTGHNTRTVALVTYCIKIYNVYKYNTYIHIYRVFHINSQNLPCQWLVF